MTTTPINIASNAMTTFEQAMALTVKTISARQLATELFDAIRAFRKQSESQKEDICRPLKDEWERVKKPYDDFKKECEAHESALQRKMGEWDREQDRLAREEQAKLQAKIDAQNAKIVQKAEAKGIEPVLKVAPVVQSQPKTVMTQSGTKQTTSKRKCYDIKGDIASKVFTAADVAVAQLLKDFPALFVLDRTKFNKLCSTGMLDNHPNVVIREEYIYSQRQL